MIFIKNIVIPAKDNKVPEIVMKVPRTVVGRANSFFLLDFLYLFFGSLCHSLCARSQWLHQFRTSAPRPNMNTPQICSVVKKSMWMPLH
jgi:hypothetical protein